MTDELAARLRQIRLLILDVDGVLTDGSITYTGSGEELKTFHVRDGSAIKLWLRAGHKLALLTGRTSHAVTRRAAELGIPLTLQGREDKAAALEEIVAATGIAPENACAAGDDLADLALFGRVGVRFAVADAVPELRAAADLVTMLPGGRGAAREVIETLLKAQDLWAGLIPGAPAG